MRADILTGSLLSRRPCQLSSSQHVDMKVVNWLSTVFSIINHCRGQKLVNSVCTKLTAGGLLFTIKVGLLPTLYPSFRHSCAAMFLATISKCPKSWKDKKEWILKNQEVGKPTALVYSSFIMWQVSNLFRISDQGQIMGMMFSRNYSWRWQTSFSLLTFVLNFSTPILQILQLQMFVFILRYCTTSLMVFFF